jgi:hypothetical protein
VHIVCMVLKTIIRSFIGGIKRLEKWSHDEQKPIYAEVTDQAEEAPVIVTVWDYFQFAENTQAYHLVNVLGYDEWIDMDEIRRRIVELFNAHYKNERSLYPYLKTLVDLGLVETSNIGGRRKWRKKEMIVTLPTKKKKKLLEATVQ